MPLSGGMNGDPAERHAEAHHRPDVPNHQRRSTTSMAETEHTPDWASILADDLIVDAYRCEPFCERRAIIAGKLRALVAQAVTDCDGDDPIDLRRAKWIEITIGSDRRQVWVNAERGNVFRCYNVGELVIRDNSATETLT
jgi:hypothetical protein